MIEKKVWVLVAAVVLATAGACQPLPTPGPKSTDTAVSSAPNVALPATAAPSAMVEPTGSPVPQTVEEEDCMAACHISDAGDDIAAGAMPQPPTHVNRTSCLDCHATLDKPALPATHVGRLNPSCVVCHLPSAK
jgi:hypothetical protein